jgi:hypothetical protein
MMKPEDVGRDARAKGSTALHGLDIRRPSDVLKSSQILGFHRRSIVEEGAIAESEKTIPGNTINLRVDAEKNTRLFFLGHDEIELI